MEKTIKIGGELESVATGGIVAAASAIKDKAKGKFQGEINAEVDASLEDRYTKEETYSKTQLDSMITTPDTPYIDVDTYAELEALTEHPAGAIYRVANYDGTQVVTNKYSEHSWNGTQYKLMAVRDHGIDNEPTAGSNNLVKSGGVYAASVSNMAYLECTSSAGTIGKVINANGFKIINGGAIKIKFTKNNAADSPTLNINSTGAYPILYNGKPASPINTWQPNEIVEFFHDGTYWNGRSCIVYNKVVNINCITSSDNKAKASGKITAVNDKYFNCNNNRIYICDSYTDANTMTFATYELATKEHLYIYDNSIYVFNGNNLVYKNGVVLIKCFASGVNSATQSGKITEQGDLYYNTNNNKIYLCDSYTDSSTMTFVEYDIPSLHNLYVCDNIVYSCVNGVLVDTDKLLKDRVTTLERASIVYVKCLASNDTVAKESGKITAVGDKYLNLGQTKYIYICTSYTNPSTMSFAQLELVVEDKLYVCDDSIYAYISSNMVKLNEDVVPLKCFAIGAQSATDSGKITDVGDLYYNTNNNKIYQCRKITTNPYTFEEYAIPSFTKIYLCESKIYVLKNGTLVEYGVDSGDSERIDNLEERVDYIEEQLGITPPTVHDFKKISGDITITQNELDSWENCEVDIQGYVTFTGSGIFSFPSNCRLKFNGGKFIGSSFTGTLNPNNAYISASPYKIIDNLSSFSGKFIADKVYGEWFGAKGDGSNDDAASFNLVINSILFNEILLCPNKTYSLEAPIVVNNVSIKGCQSSKLIRKNVYVDLPISNEITSSIIADANGNITVNVDTSSTYYNKLKVGMCVSIVPSTPITSGDLVPSIEYVHRIVKSVSNGTVVLDGGSFTTLVSGETHYNLLGLYPLIDMRRNAKVLNVQFDGKRTLIPNDRAYWRLGSTISAGIQDYSNATGELQTFGYTISECVIDNSVADAIEALGVHGLISHNVMRHSGANGVHLSNCDDIVIDHNFIFDSNINLLTGHNEAAVTYSLRIRNISITNNVVDNCRCAVRPAVTTSKTTIIGNVFRNFRLHGIWFNLTHPSSYGEYTGEYVITDNKFIATNDYYEGGITYNNHWESPFDDTPIIPRTTATGNAIKVELSGTHYVILTNISNNEFKDCGINLQNFKSIIVTSNNMLISHSYVAGEMKPNFMIKLNSCTGIVNGNIMINESSDTMSEIIKPWRSSPTEKRR